MYNLVLFAVLLIAASTLLGQLTAGQDVKIIKDLALAAIVALRALHRDLHRDWPGLQGGRTAQHLRAARETDPPPEFIAGKYVGLLLTLVVNLAVMVLAMYLVLAGLHALERVGRVPQGLGCPGNESALLTAVSLIFLELMIVTAVALFFSTFSTPILSAALTFGLYIVGNFSADLRDFDKVTDARPAINLARVLYYVLPNFSSFDVKTLVVHGEPVRAPTSRPPRDGFAYIGALLVAAMFIFSRRDFK